VSIGFQSNGPFDGTAYLMTQIGPGTTSAQQEASDNFAAASGISLTNLFSGLTLPPGLYYLVVTSSSLGAWRPRGRDQVGRNLPCPAVVCCTLKEFRRRK
jgi:hypothetical protein